MSGLMDDTPLGRVVAVRSERDRKMLEKFTPQQRKMRSEWAAFRARKAAKAFTGEQLRRQMDDLEQMMAKAADGRQKKAAPRKKAGSGKTGERKAIL